MRLTFILILALLLGLSGAAVAQESEGGSTLYLMNGTTGGSGNADQVQFFLVEGEQMTPVHSEPGVDGSAPLPDLLEPGQEYVAMAQKGEVSYSTRFTRTPGEDVDVVVYDAVTDDPGIQASLAHLVVFVHGQQLHVRRQYRVTNPTLTTWVSEDGTFDFLISPDGQQVRSFVTSNELPLSVLPNALTDPGHYQINRPIQPGDTRVEVEYSIPYAEGEKLFEEPFKADVSRAWVGVIPPDVEFFSTQLTGGQVQEDMNARVFFPKDDFAGNAFTIAMSGFGSAEAPVEAGNTSAQPQVTTILAHENRTIITYVVILALVLLAFLGLSLFRRPQAVGGVDTDIRRMSTEELQREKDRLLKRIAELDQRDRGDESRGRRSLLSPNPESQERTELKNRARMVMRRLVELGNAPETPGKP